MILTFSTYDHTLIPSRSIFEPSGCFVENPILQCVQIKTMEPKTSDANPVQRFRVVLSDVKNFIQTMIATSMFTQMVRIIVTDRIQLQTKL